MNDTSATPCARSRRAARLALGASLCVFAAAWAQTIRIPDFRQSPPAAATLKAGEPCIDCGRILSIRESRVQRKPEVPQAFQGGSPGSSGPGDRNLVGAVVYLPLCSSDSAERPFVGGVGTPEMRERFQETIYEIAVRMDDGAMRFVQRYDGTRYRVGDRVRISAPGQLEPVVEQ